MNRPKAVMIEATPNSFQADVFDRSAEMPVVVDFWAEWCPPCRQLGPLLERIAEEFVDRVALVKADVEQLPNEAARFRVQSIPAVFGVRDGRIVDSFVGLLPETRIRSFFERLLPTPGERMAAEAKAQAAADPAAAEGKYRESLSLDPNLDQARLDLARLLSLLGRFDDARRELAIFERRGPLAPEVEAFRAELALRTQAQAAGGLDSARLAHETAPDDPAASLALAEALAAEGRFVESLDLALDLVERQGGAIRDSARKTMLAVFQLLPADSDIVDEYRRRLSSALF